MRPVVARTSSLLLAIAAITAAAQITKDELSVARGLLAATREAVEKNYHDPSRLGNFRQRCEAAERLLPECKSFHAAQLIIAQLLLDLNDTHTQLYPPRPRDVILHPWTFHAVGDEVYVRAVEPGSDAEKRGLRVGDKVLAIDGMATRATNCWLMRYFLEVLAPRNSMTVLVQAPGAAARQLVIAATVSRGRAVRDLNDPVEFHRLQTAWERDRLKIESRIAAVPHDIVVWRLGRFETDRLNVGLRKLRGARAAIFDLRSNSGGSLEAAERVFAAVFDDQFTRCTLRGRNTDRTVRIRGRGEFKGPLVVLIDRNTASAAESFARTIQLRNRGKVLGERSAGASGVSQIIPVNLGSPERFIRFQVGVTVAREVMPDGGEIEGHGVIPDEVIVPTHEDLYAGRDPVLAQALTHLGAPCTPNEAGRLSFDP